MSNEQALSTGQENSDLLRQIMENSGEAENQRIKLLTIVDVNNKKKDEVEVEINGEKVKVTPPPDKIFITTEKESDEKGDITYKAVPYLDKITGIILKIRYVIEKKYQENSTSPFFRSDEFDSFNGSKPITVYTNKEVCFEGTYKQAKEAFGETMQLYAFLYVYMPESDEIIKVKCRGYSRNQMWDYIKIVGTTHFSVSAVMTEMSIEVNKEKQVAFNHIIFKTLEDKVSLEDVLEKQKQLNSYLSALSGFRQKPADIAEESKMPDFTTTPRGVAVEAVVVPAEEMSDEKLNEALNKAELL